MPIEPSACLVDVAVLVLSTPMVIRAVLNPFEPGPKGFYSCIVWTSGFLASTKPALIL